MGKSTKVSVVHRRSLNQVVIYVSRAPLQARHEAAVYVRALRSALHMSQAYLSRRSGVPQSHIALIESGRADPRIGTVRRLFDAMFCDLMVLPRPRKRPGDVLADRYLERPDWRPLWDES